MITLNKSIDFNAIDTVIFDMDGVLVDTEPVYYRVEQKLFRSLNIDITEQVHNSFIGMSMKMIWHNIKDHNKLDLSEEELIGLHKKLMIRGFKCISKPEPISGVVPLLKFLKARNIDLALASSSCQELIDTILNSLSIKKFFTAIISGEDVPAGKPEPDIFLRTLELLNKKSDKSLVIEDSTNGITAAVKAGIPCIAYNGINSNNQDLQAANLIITDFDEFRSFLAVRLKN
jgi:HAD superfamily hydrolase (TIGR01509 family)